MKKKIENSIFEGIRKSYEDNYSFTGQISSIIKPESLIHINIAQNIKKINDANHSYGDPLIIKLEEPTSVFSSACVPFQSNPDSLFNSILRDNHNTSRNGYIDIALYVKGDSIFDDKPYAAIEVKDFIKSRGELKLDIIRNSEYLNIEDKNTGKSRLKYTFLACVHEHKGAINETDKEKEIDRLKKGYEKYLKKFKLAKLNIEYKIVLKTVAEYLLGENDKYLPTEITEDKIAEAIHYIGALIIFKKH